MELWLSSYCTWIPIPFLNVTKIVVSWPFSYANLPAIMPVLPSLHLFDLQQLSHPSSNPMNFNLSTPASHDLSLPSSQCPSFSMYINHTMRLGHSLRSRKAHHFPYLILNLQEPDELDLIKNLCLKLISLALRRQHLLFTDKLQALKNRSTNANPVMKNMVFST